VVRALRPSITSLCPWPHWWRVVFPTRRVLSSSSPLTFTQVKVLHMHSKGRDDPPVEQLLEDFSALKPTQVCVCVCVCVCLCLCVCVCVCAGDGIVIPSAW
jgi:hypothetical protein